MKILVIADIDDIHWPHGIGHADLVLACGGVTDEMILEAAELHQCETIFAVKGENDPVSPFPEPIVDLHLQVKRFGRTVLSGLNGCCRFRRRGTNLYEGWEVERSLSALPIVDIFVSHNSPRGIHDGDDKAHHGFEALNHYILNSPPRLIVHGHQRVNRETTIARTRIVGVYGHLMIEI